MASTEPISGTRPAWSTRDRDSEREEATPAAAIEPTAGRASEHAPGRGSAAVAETPAPRGGRFIEELMRAMLATATESKAAAVEQAHSEAKAYAETIHDRSSEEAASFRQSADADISGIRDWSKAEMARVREETDRRIAARKDALAVELEAHAGRIEQEIELAQQRVARFEADMDVFIADLAACTDPTTMASLAEQMPEPPRFDELAPMDEAPADADAGTSVQVADATMTAAAEPEAAEPEAAAEVIAPVEVEAAIENPEGMAPEAATAESGSSQQAAASTDVADQAFTPEASAPDQAVATQGPEGDASRPDEVEPTAAEGGEMGETAGAVQPEAVGVPETDTTAPEDPAEAALAARLSRLTPTAEIEPAAPTHVVPEPVAAPLTGAPVTTRVSVAGLVSVSGIAAFKRNLARLPGVLAVGVSSSPDGAFVFNVSHDPSLSLDEVIPSLPGFGARISKVGEGTLGVTARDPGQE